MKLVVIILLGNVVTKSEGSCDFDNKTLQLFWKKDYSMFVNETFSFQCFLYYHEIKRKIVSMLNFNHPNLQCDIEDICNIKFPIYEKDYDDY